jgi:hypothetical protein
VVPIKPNWALAGKLEQCALFRTALAPGMWAQEANCWRGPQLCLQSTAGGVGISLFVSYELAMLMAVRVSG